MDPQNLFRSAARVAIVKKNATVLRKLVTDIKANKNAFAEIPVLLIDDESDQASINTVDPEKVRAASQEGKEIKKRQGDQRTDRGDARTDATGAVRGLHGNAIRKRVRGSVRSDRVFSRRTS